MGMFLDKDSQTSFEYRVLKLKRWPAMAVWRMDAGNLEIGSGNFALNFPGDYCGYLGV